MQIHIGLKTLELAQNYERASARDRSGKPEARLVLRADGLGTDSPVPLRLAWQAAPTLKFCWASRLIF
ncbi:MAG: hypothetical protein ACKVOQ_04845 [Cyclobacteriaceae bacterium]